MDINKKLRVTVHYPETMPESARQRKINRLYDILMQQNIQSA